MTVHCSEGHRRLAFRENPLEFPPHGTTGLRRVLHNASLVPVALQWSSQPAFRRTVLWLLLPVCLYAQQTSSAHTLLMSAGAHLESLLSCGRVWEAQRCHCHWTLRTMIGSPERRILTLDDEFCSVLSGAWDHRARQPKAVASTVLRRLSSGASLPPRPSPLLATRLSTCRLSSRHPRRLRPMNSPGHQPPP